MSEQPQPEARRDQTRPEPTLSVLILAKDAEEHLTDCIASVRWADEVIVVIDASSRDATEAIALANADLIAVRTFDDFASQRNAALDLAAGDWVLAIDADERASADLAREIRSAIKAQDPETTGYRVPIASVILGKPFGYSGTQDDRPLRLFKRGHGRWVGRVHETVELDGSAGLLAHSLQHKTIPDMKTFLAKIDHYTTLEALAFVDQGKPARTIDLTVKPAWTFVKLYMIKQGFRDGLEGLVFCAMSGVSVAVRSWKHRELWRLRRPA